MFRKVIVIILSVFLVAFNANAGSDGDLALKKNEPKKVKDCFEKLKSDIF